MKCSEQRHKGKLLESLTSRLIVFIRRVNNMPTHIPGWIEPTTEQEQLQKMKAIVAYLRFLWRATGYKGSF